MLAKGRSRGWWVIVYKSGLLKRGWERLVDWGIRGCVNKIANEWGRFELVDEGGWVVSRFFVVEF